MAYEAYKAAVNHIAHKVYDTWATSGDHESTLGKLCRESNVEAHHVRYKLTEIINTKHMLGRLDRYDANA